MKLRCLFGHKWKQFNHLEHTCERCGVFKIFYGYATTGTYKENIKPREEMK